MHAYLFWHRPYASVDATQYEEALLSFHEHLTGQSPPGFRGSASYRVRGFPWLGKRPGYEDWYLIDGSWALDPLNDLAVTGRMETPHAAAAAQMEVGYGGYYVLLWGTPLLAEHLTETWLTRPRGIPWRPALHPLRNAHSGMTCWRRQMVLGPAPEFVMVGASEQKNSQPSGWAALPVSADRVGQNGTT